MLGCRISDFMISDIPSQRWHCKMAWTSKPSAVCSATMMPDSHSAPTPTLRGRSKTRQHKRWAASWRRSCKQKKAKNTREKAKASSPVLFKSFYAFRCVGHGVGQAVDPHFDPHLKVHFCNEKHPKSEDSRCFLELLTRFELVTSSLPRDFWRFL